MEKKSTAPLNQMFDFIKKEQNHLLPKELWDAWNKVSDAQPYDSKISDALAYMLQQLEKETNRPLSSISLQEQAVYEMLSESVKLEGHSYLPDGTRFFLGIWGFPGIGTRQTLQVLQKEGRIADFQTLVMRTRDAIDWGKKEEQESKSQGARSTAIVEALVGYYMAWYCWYDWDAWMKCYERMINFDKQEMQGYLTSKENELSKYRLYWEDILELNWSEHYSSDWGEYFEKKWNYIITRTEKGKEECDIDAFVKDVTKVNTVEGALCDEDFGREILTGTYLDFWRWIYEDYYKQSKYFQEDEILTQIACYVETEFVWKNKRKLCKVLVDYAIMPEGLQIPFHSQKPSLTYDQRRRTLAINALMEKLAAMRGLQAFSDSFTKFSRETASGAWIQQCTSEEFLQWFDRIFPNDLEENVLCLYTPAQRNCVLEAMEMDCKHYFLEEIKKCSMLEEASEEWITAERKIAARIEELKEEQKAMQ